MQKFKEIHPSCMYVYAKSFCPYLQADEVDLHIKFEDYSPLMLAEVRQTSTKTEKYQGKTILFRTMNDGMQRMLQPLNNQPYGDEGEYLLTEQGIIGVIND